VTQPYRIFGSELSPYSVKVRSYFRYKGIPHEWVERSAQNQAEFERHARLPLIPLVIAPEGEGWQDSTPILERLEAIFPEPSISPRDPALSFLSALIEEYADEWGNKPMFHYRWTYAADRDSAADRLARSNLPGADEAALRAASAGIARRMQGRLALVGSCEATRETIEGSFRRTVAILDAHLAARAYLLGDRPALADFGLFAQLYECATDPTPGAILRESGPNALAWAQRMLEPRAEGGFDRWAALEPTLLPLLREEVAGCFLPWSEANRRALEEGRDALELTLAGRPFRQQPQKYHARSLAALRARYRAVSDRSALDPILARAGCLEALRDYSPSMPSSASGTPSRATTTSGPPE
jgi:glutathione S-transferase